MITRAHIAPTRRTFLRTAAGAAVAVATGHLAGPVLSAQSGHRQVRIGGRPITVVDVHGHCLVPEVMPMVKGLPMAAGLEIPGPLVLSDERLKLIDAQGIDIQVLSINAFWYDAPEPLARDIVRVQNEGIAAWCTRHPGRFAGLASVALQFPEVAAEQLRHAVTKLGLRGAAIGGSVEGFELSDRRFDPLWTTAESLRVPVFMHPQPSTGTTKNARLAGKGNLVNTVGNPLETTVFLSHLIFEGTLDRFPGLRIVAAHGGGYLPSYLGRSDAACTRQPDACDQRKRPTDAYFKDQITVDTMVFRDDGLRHLVAELGASQIVYGTDLPFPWPVGVDFVLNAAFLSDAQKEAILGGNAIKLLGLSGSR